MSDGISAGRAIGGMKRATGIGGLFFKARDPRPT